MMNGLTTINIELTSRCNKGCWMCGRRKIDKEYPELALNYGDMDFSLVEKIASQVPSNITIQFHNNGEPTLYPRLGEALSLFQRQIRSFNTNGKLLVKKAKEIIGNLDSLCISVIENDPDSDEQYEIVKEFLKIKGDRKPFMIYRCLGDVNIKRWEELNGLIVKRILHNPMGSFDYKKEPVIPEIGICWDMMGHLAINRFGDVSCCVRFDPTSLGVLGSIKTETLDEIWNGSIRQEWLKLHIAGKRHNIPICSKCEFWGVPRG